MDHHHSHSHSHDHDHSHSHDHSRNSADTHGHAHTHAHDHGDGMPHTFADMERNFHVFETPAREQYQPVDTLLDLVQGPRQVAVDVGASTGYFVKFLAPRYQQVFAVDVEPAACEWIAKRFAGTNVVPVLGTRDGFALPCRADLLVCVDVLHHIDDQVAYFARLREHHAHPGSTLLLIDWKPGLQMREGQEIGPKERWGVKVSPQTATERMEHAGWKLTRNVDTAHHWNLFFVPK